MEVVSKNLTNILVKREIIKQEDYEVYQFGIECFIVKAFHIISYLTLGAIFHKLWEVLIFLITFIPLRVYAGGYHAKTPLRCYIISCSAVFTAICVMQNVPSFVMPYGIVLAVAASLILLFIIPVEAGNKPLDDIEAVYYKKKAVIMLVSVLGLATVFKLASLNYISFIISLSLVYELGIALAGKALNDSN